MDTPSEHGHPQRSNLHGGWPISGLPHSQPPLTAPAHDQAYPPPHTEPPFPQQTGRETLEAAIRLVEGHPEWRAKVVYGDTDSLFVQLPGRSRDEAFRIGWVPCSWRAVERMLRPRLAVSAWRAARIGPCMGSRLAQ
jgi:hypothetical protein